MANGNGNGKRTAAWVSIGLAVLGHFVALVWFFAGANAKLERIDTITTETRLEVKRHINSPAHREAKIWHENHEDRIRKLEGGVTP